MKNWYISILAKDDSDINVSVEEVFDYILQGSKRDVIKQAKELTRSNFVADCGTECTSMIVDEIYETSSEATL